MKLAVFGNNRSGTTLLLLTLWRHLVAVGENEPWSYIAEAFSTSKLSANLLIEQDGHLQMQRSYEMEESQEYSIIPETPSMRFASFLKYHHQDYAVKLMPHDVNISGIIPWMRSNYSIIAIERRNPLASFISSLIAHKHNKWHVHTWEELPPYIPFVADEKLMEFIGYPFVQYYQYRDKLNPTHIIQYEDIENASQSDILQMVGMVPISDKIYQHPTTIKLHSDQEKMDLILNLDEVSHYFETIMKPYNDK